MQIKKKQHKNDMQWRPVGIKTDKLQQRAKFRLKGIPTWKQSQVACYKYVTA
jgi:hypothetical protein